MKKTAIIFLISIFFAIELFAQVTINIYDSKIPNSKSYSIQENWKPQDGDTIVSLTSIPTITAFLPDKRLANGSAVVICPGGGYRVTSIVKEGFAVAREFNKWGVTAFVLKYRIPDEASMEDRSIGPLQDAQRAIQLVRTRAKEWNIDIKKVGIMGFSAGGHLASTAATHFDHNYIDNPGNVNLRPDFAILIYPVISFQDSIGHLGSRDQLIGKNPSNKARDLFSNELQVDANTPPAFLIHASDDKDVQALNSVRFYEALLKFKIPAELHIYSGGGHGFGMDNPTSRDAWMDRCRNWMESMHLVR